MWREMVLTSQVTGMPAMDVIVAATAINAKILGADDQIGTLEPGKYADILIIDGDPLADLANMKDVYAVYKGGVLVD
jgi:imidazolonepropionase-like amidohydrolase